MTSKRRLEANRRNLAKRRGLTPEGRERLRESALRNKPWEHSTGPRTDEGRDRSRMNALKHGRDTADRRAFCRDAFRFIRLAKEYRREIRRGTSPRSHPMLVRAAALMRLAQVLELSLEANRANHANHANPP